MSAEMDAIEALREPLKRRGSETAWQLGVDVTINAVLDALAARPAPETHTPLLDALDEAQALLAPDVPDRHKYDDASWANHVALVFGKVHDALDAEPGQPR